MCGSLPGFGVFPYLSLIQRAGGSSKECVCVGVCVCVHCVCTRMLRVGEKASSGAGLGCLHGEDWRRATLKSREKAVAPGGGA